MANINITDLEVHQTECTAEEAATIGGGLWKEIGAAVGGAIGSAFGGVGGGVGCGIGYGIGAFVDWLTGK